MTPQQILHFDQAWLELSFSCNQVSRLMNVVTLVFGEVKVHVLNLNLSTNFLKS